MSLHDIRPRHIQKVSAMPQNRAAQVNVIKSNFVLHSECIRDSIPKCNWDNSVLDTFKSIFYLSIAYISMQFCSIQIYIVGYSNTLSLHKFWSGGPYFSPFCILYKTILYNLIIFHNRNKITKKDVNAFFKCRSFSVIHVSSLTVAVVQLLM